LGLIPHVERLAMLQVSYGEGIIARTTEAVVDAAVNTPTAANFFTTQLLQVACGRQYNETQLQQVRCSFCCSMYSVCKHRIQLYFGNIKVLLSFNACCYSLQTLQL
jgi:hypothetical protein